MGRRLQSHDLGQDEPRGRVLAEVLHRLNDRRVRGVEGPRLWARDEMVVRDRAPKVHGTPRALRTARRDRRLEAQEPLRGDDVLVRSQTHSPMAFAATRVEEHRGNRAR